MQPARHSVPDKTRRHRIVADQTVRKGRSAAMLGIDAHKAHLKERRHYKESRYAQSYHTRQRIFEQHL